MIGPLIRVDPTTLRRSGKPGPPLRKSCGRRPWLAGICLLHFGPINLAHGDPDGIVAEDGLGSDRFKDKFEWVILLKNSAVEERAALRAVELPASIEVAAVVVVQWAEGRQSS